MITAIETSVAPKPGRLPAWLGHMAGWPREVWLLAAALLVMNGLTAPEQWHFQAAPVLAGEWWRLVTFPFAHIGGYHLLLDAGSFLCLYTMWGEKDWRRRLTLMAGAFAGTLLAPLLTVPGFGEIGLRGLSGPAHGLMALVCLDLWRDRRREDPYMAAAAAVLFAGLAGKAMAEAWTGGVLFQGLHLGNIGTPVAVCHAGGMLGAMLPRLLLRTDAIRG